MADILKALSPEQLKALTPECMRIIMGNDMLENDVVEIRHFLNGIKYVNGQSYVYGDKTGLENFSKILLRHHRVKFYLTYEYSVTSIPYFLEMKKSYVPYLDDETKPLNYKIYTEDEIKKIVPTGCDLDKICFSKGDKLFKTVKYPYGYEKPKDKIENIEHLAFYHDNIHFVHPILMAHAHHFLS